VIRKLKRCADFDLSLEVQSDDFIRPPRDAQRHALLNRSVREFSDDLKALDRIAGGFVRGVDELVFLGDRTRAELRDQEIMEDWQIPIMKAMAGCVSAGGGDVLEIGFGRGISATFVQDGGVRSHTIVECNDDVVRRFWDWRAGYEDRDIRLIHDKWQNVLTDLESFDGILFHTYPLDENEYMEYAASSVTFAQHFFAVAAGLLRPGGVFTYLTNEIDSLSRGHQRLLFAHFESITSSVVQGLSLPDDVADLWWADSMVVVKAVK